MSAIKRLLLFVIPATLLLVASCGDEEEEKTKNLGENPHAADYNIEIDTANPPVMSFEEEHWEFGDIDQGKKVEHKFKFKNTGGSTLVIKDAYSGCGCTIPEYPFTPIKPGESGEIKVVFNSKNKKDKVHKTIVILANTYPKETNTISISGNVLTD